MTQPVIALLRGINVGGRNRLPMVELRSIAADLGFADAKTYLQSGNLILPDAPLATAEIAATLTGEIRTAFGLEVPVIIRTAGDWARVIAANPFPEAAADGTKLHVMFLPGLATEAVRSFAADAYRPEELSVADFEIYLSLPNGIGRSKLAGALGKVDNAASGTIRNWNTVLALSDLSGDP